MTIKLSGPLSLTEIAAEFGGAAPHSLSEYYAGGLYVPSGTAGIPASGLISFNVFYGATAVVGRGYFGGGVKFNGSTNDYYNFVDAIIFASNTSHNPSAVLADGARGVRSAYNSSVKGYWHGGLIAGNSGLTVLDGLLFSNESAINYAATVNARAGAGGFAAASNSTTKGYVAGGTGNGGGGVTDNFIEGLFFSNDTISIITNRLFNTSYFDGAVGVNYSSHYFEVAVNSSVKGYYMGVFSSKGGSAYSYDSLVFSNETTINEVESATMPVLNSGSTNSQTAGYLFAGTSVEKILFSNGAISRFSLSSSISGCGANSNTHGYFVNDVTFSAIVFATETFLNTGATVPEGNRTDSAGFQSGGYL